MSHFLWDVLQFREPWWLLLALQPVLISLLAAIRYRHYNREYADQALMPWVVAGTAQHDRRRLISRFLLMQWCWLLLALAMAGPRYPDPVRTPDRANTADIMVVLDVSRSMTATDIRPDRLKRAKTELFQLLMQNKTDRIGIILFAGHAHVLSPLTWDRQVSRFYVDSIQSGLLPSEGSNIKAAIDLANQSLQASKNPVILLMSDGDFNQSGQTVIESRLAVHILGMGTTGGSSLADDEGGWMSYDNQPVITRLQPQVLSDIASRSGGQYETVSSESGLLSNLFQRTSSSKASQKSVKEQDQAWVELYPWLLVPVLLMFLLMSLRWTGLSQKQEHPIVMLLLILSFAFIPIADIKAQPLSAETETLAYQAYSQKDFQKAMEMYSLSIGYKARMGEGASAVQIKDYKRAITQFTQAFLVAVQDSERANALYNLANSFFYIEDYAAAQSVFADVLKYQPHKQAETNLAFVTSLIDSIQDDPFTSQARAKRGNRGPRSQLVDDATRGGGDFSLDDSEKEIVSSRRNKTNSDGSLSDIIASGKGQGQVADESIQEQSAVGVGEVSVSDLLMARKWAVQEKQNQTQLWKSLFEETEGFPAPVEKPVVEPGVLPW